MPDFISPEFVIYGYIILLMSGMAVLGFVAQHLSGKLNETKNALNKTTADLSQARKQFAYARNQLEEKFRTNTLEEFLDRIPAGIVVINNQKLVTDWNPEASRLTEIEKLNAVLKPLTETIRMIDFSGNDISDSFLTNCLSANLVAFPAGTKFHCNDNTIPVSGFVAPIVSGDDNHSDCAILVFFKDTEISEKLINARKDILNLKNDLDSAHRELSHFRHLSGISGNLVNTLNIGIISIDSQKRIFSLNEVAENFTGQLEIKTKGQEFDRVLSLTNGKEEPETEIITEALSGKTISLPKWTFLSSKNGRTAISGSISPINLTDAETGCVLAFRNAEQEYREEAEEKGFISGAAHDLRAPLTTIRGVIELLNDNFDSLNREDTKEILRGANDSVLHLIDLVNDLLNVSRLEQGRITVVKKPTDLTKIVTEVIDSFQATARKKNLSLNYNPLEMPIPKVNADEMRLKEIMTNLISNAVKYTIRGTITVTQRSDGAMAFLTVTDTGPGIEPESQPLLFRKFQQVGSARQLSHSKSTGLGLYLAKKFALLMNGDLYLVRSEPEKGSVFEVKIPICTG